MKCSVPDPKPPIARKSPCPKSRVSKLYKDGSDPSPYDRKDTPRALADCLLSEKHSAEEEPLIPAERMVTVSQAAMTDYMADFSGLIKDDVTASATPEGHNGAKRSENRLQDMLLGLVNKTIEEKLNFVEFKTPSPAENWRNNFVTPVSKEDDGIHVGQSWRYCSSGKDRQERNKEGNGCLMRERRSAPTICWGRLRYRRTVCIVKQRTLDGSFQKKRTNKKGYAKMSKEQAPDFQPWNDVTVDKNSRWYKTKPERKLDVAILRVFEHANDRFAAQSIT